MNPRSPAVPVPITDQRWEQGVPPVVSISCTTYNHAPFIRQAMDGFLMQRTTFPVEILIHDDASTDETAEIIKEYEEKYGALIHPVYQSGNQYSQGVRGMMARFNFPRARGKYIALCEGDDYWTDPLKLQKQVDFLEANEEYSACFTNATILNEIDHTSSDYVTFLNEGEVSMEEIVRIGGYIYPTASLVIRKRVIQEDMFEYLFEDLAGDTVMIVNAAMQGKVFFLNQITAVYRRWSGGLYSQISGDPQRISDWKMKRIKGYKKMQRLVDGKLKKSIRAKISSESLYILRNSHRVDRLLYVMNLTMSDQRILIAGHLQHLMRRLKSLFS